MKVIVIITGVIILLLLAASAAGLSQRLRQDRAAEAIGAELAGGTGAGAAGAPADVPAMFDPSAVDALPEPARRWLRYAIEPGTPLAASVELVMRGTLRLDDGGPWQMTARQVISPPDGFIWRARASRGVLTIRGFDRYIGGAGEMRWWLWGVAPVMSGSGRDISRSAAGRLAGEAVLLPSSLLPATGVSWEAVDDDVARATLTVDDEPVTFTIDVAPDGRLRRVVIRRWNGDPANGDVGYMPFVVDFEGERFDEGYRLPRRIRAGWEREGMVREFFAAELTAVRFE